MPWAQYNLLCARPTAEQFSRRPERETHAHTSINPVTHKGITARPVGDREVQAEGRQATANTNRTRESAKRKTSSRLLASSRFNFCFAFSWSSGHAHTKNVKERSMRRRATQARQTVKNRKDKQINEKVGGRQRRRGVRRWRVWQQHTEHADLTRTARASWRGRPSNTERENFTPKQAEPPVSM